MFLLVLPFWNLELNFLQLAGFCPVPLPVPQLTYSADLRSGFKIQIQNSKLPKVPSYRQHSILFLETLAAQYTVTLHYITFRDILHFVTFEIS